MRRSLLVASSIAISIGLSLGASPALAAPAPIECGSVVSGKAVLTHDLTCAAGAGLTLNPGAVLDLKGFTLAGPGSAGFGITIAPVDGDTTSAGVKNGTVSGWSSALSGGQFGVTTAVSVYKLTLTGNTTGIELLNGDLTLSSSSVAGNEAGVSGTFLQASVANTTFSDNGTAFGIAGGGVSIRKSTFDGNVTGVSCAEGGYTLTSNVFTDNTFGMSSTDCSNNTLVGNKFDSNGSAYSASVFGDYPVRDVLRLNRFTNNTAAVRTSATTDLTANVFYKNGAALTVSEGFFPRDVTLDKNVFTLNVDAVNIAIPGTLKDNVAIKNAHYGIYAPLATDLGGNRAYLNGYTPQCTGVSC